MPLPTPGSVFKMGDLPVFCQNLFDTYSKTTFDAKKLLGRVLIPRTLIKFWSQRQTLMNNRSVATTSVVVSASCLYRLSRVNTWDYLKCRSIRLREFYICDSIDCLRKHPTNPRRRKEVLKLGNNMPSCWCLQFLHTVNSSVSSPPGKDLVE